MKKKSRIRRFRFPPSKSPLKECLFIEAPDGASNRLLVRNKKNLVNEYTGVPWNVFVRLAASSNPHEFFIREIMFTYHSEKKGRRDTLRPPSDKPTILARRPEKPAQGRERRTTPVSDMSRRIVEEMRAASAAMEAARDSLIPKMPKLPKEVEVFTKPTVEIKSQSEIDAPKVCIPEDELKPLTTKEQIESLVTIQEDINRGIREAEAEAKKSKQAFEKSSAYIQRSGRVERPFRVPRKKFGKK